MVSCERRCDSNKAQIPESMRGFSSSEYFPYHETPAAQLQQHAPTRDAFSALCEDKIDGSHPPMDNLLTAFQVVMAQWASEPPGHPVSVEELIDKAKTHARPNVFKSLRKVEAPRWLLDLVKRFPSASIRVQSTNLVVSIEGLQVTLPGSLEGVTEEEVDRYENVQGEAEFVQALFELSTRLGL